MAYTPPFQEVINKLDALIKKNTPIEVVREFFKQSMIALGPYERINNLYKVRNKIAKKGNQSRYTSFRMNRVQDHYWKHRTHRDSILKMRQVGTTTLSCIIALDMCLFSQGANAAIMAQVLPNVKKYFRITKNAFTQFQKDWGQFYPITNIVDNVAELHIKETGSILMVCTETKGLTLDFLHISEAAFVEENRIQESTESVPLSGYIIMESTPDSASGTFYDIWNNYLRGEQGRLDSLYTCHFYPWWEHYPEPDDIPILNQYKNMPITDEDLDWMNKNNLKEIHVIFRKLKISESGGNESEFLKKYPEDPITCFLSGSHSVFDGNLLRALWSTSKDPSFKGDLKLHAN